VKERIIHPYKIFVRYGQLYCIAFCEMRKDVRTFRVDRFVEVSKTNEKFKIQKNFSVNEYFENTIHTFVESGNPITIKAWVSNKLKTYLQYSPITKSQRIYSENGNHFVEFEVLSVKDFMIWAFSWMDDIRVVEPPEVVEKMKEAYQKILSMYSPEFLRNEQGGMVGNVLEG
ncbi:MAG: WYL domain-containing protein, partial [Spirochaetes bacterium]|nr:WYL domain-containing protein [Spirochaetota bacterium]